MAGRDGDDGQQSLFGAHDPFVDTAPQPVVPPTAAAAEPPPVLARTVAPAPGRRNPLVWVALAVVALLLVGAGGVWALARSAPAAPGAAPSAGGTPSTTQPAAAPPPGSSPTAGTAPLPAAEPTLVLGDSLALVVYPYLADLLPDRYVSYVGGVGLSTARIADELDATRSVPPVVVVSAGTNDRVAADVGPGVARILATLGAQRCVVWVDVVRPDGYGDPASAVNAAIDAAVAGHPNVRVLRWSAIVAEHPEYLARDGIHPTTEGAKVRARAFADAAAGCSPIDPTAPRAPRQVLPDSIFWGPISGSGSSGSGSSGSGSSRSSSASPTRSSSRSSSPTPTATRSSTSPSPTASTATTPASSAPSSPTTTTAPTAGPSG